MLCAWSTTIEPPRLALPRFRSRNGRHERLVLVNWLLTTTVSLARVMNRPGLRRLVKVLEARTRLACTGTCEATLFATTQVLMLECRVEQCEHCLPVALGGSGIIDWRIPEHPAVFRLIGLDLVIDAGLSQGLL